MASNRPGTLLETFVESVQSILTEYEPVGSHGDPVHAKGHVIFLCFMFLFPENLTLKHNFSHMACKIKYYSRNVRLGLKPLIWAFPRPGDFSEGLFPLRAQELRLLICAVFAYHIYISWMHIMDPHHGCIFC